MKNFYKSLSIILFTLICSVSVISSAEAADTKRYWVAVDDGTDKMWHDSANWAKSINGPSGFNPPTSRQQAFFNARSTVDVKLGANVNKIKKLRVSGAYSGTIDLNGYHLASQGGPVLDGGTVLVSAGSFLQTWGWFYINSGAVVTASGDASRIKIAHNLSINGGTLTAPSGDKSRFILMGGFNLYGGGIFNHNNGTVSMTPKWQGLTGAAIRINGGPGVGRNFYNLYKNGNKNVTITTDDITIENNLKMIGVGRIRAQTNNITIGGDWDLLSWRNFDAGTGKVIFNGSAAQTIHWQTNNTYKFNNLQISNPNVSFTRSSAVSGTLTIDTGATLDINGKNLSAATLVNNGNLQLEGGGECCNYYYGYKLGDSDL